MPARYGFCRGDGRQLPLSQQVGRLEVLPGLQRVRAKMHSSHNSSSQNDREGVGIGDREAQKLAGADETGDLPTSVGRTVKPVGASSISMWCMLRFSLAVCARL